MMTLRTIAMKNIIRRKGKMALVVFGLALAVATLVAVVSINRTAGQVVDDELNDYGYNILIIPKSNKISVQYGGMTIGSVKSGSPASGLGPREEAAVGEVADESGLIKSYSAKLFAAAEINKKKVLVAGVDLAKEKRIKSWWIIEAGRYPTSNKEVFVGEIAAEKLGLELGDRLRIFGRSVTVAGILMETGSQDDSLIFTDLAFMQKVSGRGDSISIIEVAARDIGEIDPLVGKLSAKMPDVEVTSVKQAVDLKENTLSHVLKFGLGVNGVVVLISAFIVFVSMASAVNERRSEIGIFRAVGFRRRQVAAIILTEASILGAVAGVLGYVIGFALAWVLPIIGGDLDLTALTSQTLYQAGELAKPARVEPSLTLFIISVLLAVTIGLIASYIPARRAANLDPIESLKSL